MVIRICEMHLQPYTRQSHRLTPDESQLEFQSINSVKTQYGREIANDF